MLTQIIRDISKITDGMSRPVYRGQANAEWKVKSGAVRRIERANDVHDDQQFMELIRACQNELTDCLRILGYSHKDDESRLAELQHHGVATQLVDFTESPLVALWFACSELNEGETKKEGKVFVTDIGIT